jgi:rhamnose utilization protein RhaD (predicted bifunctional aldolase and dehydrogenase)/NAD(P)-dependent dehydrogenase (short-subunit alcohol dehydrogenase family)
MRSRWVDRDADATVDRYARAGIASELALRVYSTRLLGADPKLVLHGGGNTSLKTQATDLVGDAAEVMYVKGSGADMAAVEPAGMPAVRLGMLRKLRRQETLSDDDMVRVCRASLIDPLGPNPSVEVLLHAFLPAKYVDHTHATAVLSVIDQPDGMERARDVYDGAMGVVPYVKSGFGLAKKAAEVFDADPSVSGLILHKHGIFTFGASAREAYERMIEMVTRAEARLKRGRKAVFATAALPQRPAALAEVAPLIRGACAQKDENVEGAWKRMICEFRNGPMVLDYVNGEDLGRYSQQGVVTPDHTIRTKNWPLLLPAPAHDKLADFRAAARSAAEKFVATYKTYFAHHNARTGGGKTMLDPLPRVVLVPGLGLFGLGASRRGARIAADLAEATIECIIDAEATGRFESISEAEMFDVEYWSPEQAKLGKVTPPPLAGQVAAVTGAAGAIGFATARAFAAAGAELALLDIEEDTAREKAKAIGPDALALRCDVTDPQSVCAAFDKIVETFGGVDIVVSNAGAAWQGRIGEVDEAILRKSFELNFYGHQRVAQAAVKIMLAQGTGGCLLFNVSKQAVNPGPNFGPYGLPKAATMLLVRQYAVDYGADGIRSNGVNADRIRSGLLTEDFIKQRARARGISENEYMSGNLLGREVTAEDVAQAFLHQALELKTTGDITTVDGGNVAAALR